jgi:hypothetical protein
MNKTLTLAQNFLVKSNSDAVSIGIIDFNKGEYQSAELLKNEPNFIVDAPYIYYDLASLTKPLTNGIAYLERRSEMTHDLELLLNHRAGLVAWGLLPKDGWRELLLSYSLKESPTLYSDYSAIRFMLDFENVVNINLFSLVKKYWHPEIKYWKELTVQNHCLQNGFRDGKANLGIVHDPNAYTINDYVTHAGLFGTITGVCETLLNLEKNFKLCELMQRELKGHNNRFHNGWDRAQDLATTLAGQGCSEHTFGHLGFTGTSIWIDSVKKLGHVILSNATKYYWYDKAELNIFRKELGSYIWQKNF